MCILERLSVEQKKQYNKLVSYYLEITGNRPNISFGGESEELNESCPAQVWPNDEIKLWNELKETNLLEAIAHEMGHIFLRHKGLIALDSSNDENTLESYGHHYRIVDLQREINDAISHNHLIPMLEDCFGIYSEKQRILRCKSAEQIKIQLQMCNTIPGVYQMIDHHIEGIIAYDILKCSLKNSHYVNQVIEISPKVKMSFDAASKFLSQIYLGLDIDAQIDLLKKFFEAIGYPASLFKILEPFPLIKSKTQIYCFSSHKELLHAN